MISRKRTQLVSAVLTLLATVPAAMAVAQAGTKPTGAQAEPGEASVQVATLALQAVKDNTLYEDASGGTSNGAGAYLFVGNSNRGVIRRAVVEFDVAAQVPEGATIIDAKLKLHMSRTSSSAHPVSVHVLESEWGEGASNADRNEGSGAEAEEGDATWVHTFHRTARWSEPGGDFSSEPSATVDVDREGTYQWESVRMIADAQGWLDDPDSNHGWVLVGNEVATSGENLKRTSKRFDSRENSTEEMRPVLELAYEVSPATPETATPDTPSPQTPEPSTQTPTAGTPTQQTPTAATPETATPATPTSATPTPDDYLLYLPVACNGESG